MVATIAVVLERRWNTTRREGEDWSVKRDRSRLGRGINEFDRAAKLREQHAAEVAAKKKK